MRKDSGFRFRGVKWSWTLVPRWGHRTTNQSVGLTFIFKCWLLTSCNPCRHVHTHTPTFPPSCGPCLCSREAGIPWVLPFRRVFLQYFFFSWTNTQSGFHHNHPHPLHPSQEGAEVNAFNIFKKINDFFSRCIEQRCVTFFVFIFFSVFV